MTAYDFYKWFAIGSEATVLLPVVIALRQWKNLSLIMKLVAGFLMSELLFYIAQDTFFFLGKSTLFFNYYFTLAFHSVLGLFFIIILSTKTEKWIVFILIILGYGLLTADYPTLERKALNENSGMILSLLIFFLSIYSLYRSSSKMPSAQLYILIALSVQFLLWSLNYLANKVLLQSQSLSIIWLNQKIIFYYLLFLVFGLYAYAFNNYQHEKK